MPRPTAVALWGAVQGIALLTAAAGVRLWPRHPNPPESLALPELVGVQIVAAALLFPTVFADGPTLLVNLALAVPLLQLAGVLSVAPQRAVITSTAFVAIWAIGLTGWARLARTDAVRGWAVAAATSLTVGATLLWYARAESAAGSGSEIPDPLRFGPLTAGIAAAAVGSTRVDVGWIAVSVPLATSGVAAAWAAVHRGRKRLPQSPTESPLGPPTGENGDRFSVR